MGKTMLMRFYLMLLCLWMNKDCMSSLDPQIPSETHVVALGDAITLNCSYNCATGFVRGCWRKAPVSFDCFGEKLNDKDGFCTVKLHLVNVSAEDLKYTYYCDTEATDQTELQQKKELVVHLKAQTIVKTWTETPTTETEDGAAYSSSSPPHSCVVVSPLNEYSQNQRLTLRGSNPDSDNESQTEVPYADIIITVRGVSTPELSQISYLTTEEPQQWRGCGPRGHWQASCSADRLHLPQPREVSRKMSTNSEYAVIKYA
uniref:uncharacterized protein LOC131134580 isoform X2 n=1 Tax=Doryrhamphus excisus TaxID=161450 RepID=UPI0025AE0170|nr:uncharacterized protein LOC131134580 isoform X2 [Doryrhamphus excisus]